MLLVVISHNMDSLTARLMSTSGLSRTDPLLPPVHGMRMVYLKEEFGDAEKDLHAARLALKNLEDGTGTATQLYAAMAKLQTSEADYFASRYFGRDRAVLKGWKHDGKQEILRAKIQALKRAALAHKTAASPIHASADDAAAASVKACSAVESLDDSWYSNPLSVVRNRLGASTGFGTHPKDIERAIADIRGNLVTAESLPATTANKPAIISSINESLRDALVCQRLAEHILLGKWDLA